jgi:two-component system, OmpR family, sensor histidine kinase KdpD
MTTPRPASAQLAPRRIVAVVLDIHADLETLIREAAWIVRERGGELRLFLRQPVGWRLWLHGAPDIAHISSLAERWKAKVSWWRDEAELAAGLADSTSGAVTELIMGPRRRWPWESGLSSTTSAAIETAALAIGAPITQEMGRRRHYAQMWQDFEWRLDQRRPWFHEYVLSAFAVSIAAIAAKWIGSTIPSANLSTIFLAAVVYSASAYGLAAGLFTCAFSLVVVEFFFVAPRSALSDTSLSLDNLLLLLMFVVVAAITSNLAARLRSQARRAERQAIEARALFQLTRDIAVASDTDGIFRAIVRQSEYLFECESVLLAPYRLSEAIDSVRTRATTLQVVYPPTAQLSQLEIEAAREAFTAGILPTRSEAQPGADIYFPLVTSDTPVAVLMLRAVAEERSGTETFRRLVESLCRIAAIAVERTLRKQELENARVVAQSEKLRSALLSSISHDFGTPLASIIGSATSLLSYGATYPADVINELLTTIMEEAERLNRFVKNVLQMNKLESGVLVPRLQWADASDIVSTALDASHRRLQNHEIYVDVADRLPLVHVDFILMENVLINLLDNAVKYAPIDSDIQITVRALGNDVAIDVTDQGRGIAPDELGAVFDKFYRAKQGDRTVPGTGLGLAICKGIVESHEGSIEALSEGPGQGTTIRIRLPIKEPDDDEMAEI